MTSVIKTKIKAKMESMEEEHPDFNPKKDYAVCKSDFLMLNEFPLGDDEDSNDIKFRCTTYRVKVSAKDYIIPVLNPNQYYISLFEAYCDNNCFVKNQSKAMFSELTLSDDKKKGKSLNFLDPVLEVKEEKQFSDEKAKKKKSKKKKKK